MASYTAYSDEQLLKAFYADDQLAFAEILERYSHTLYLSVYSRIRSGAIAEEIVHDLFVTLWDKRKTLLITNLSHYLLVAVKHRTISYIRSQIVQQKYWEYYKAFIPQRENDTEKDVVYDELVTAIEKGMEHLPEKTKKVFRLNRLEGRSVTEIASLLKVSEKAIEYHLTRSLKEMKIYLKDFIV